MAKINGNTSGIMEYRSLFRMLKVIRPYLTIVVCRKMIFSHNYKQKSSNKTNIAHFFVQHERAVNTLEPAPLRLIAVSYTHLTLPTKA